MGETSHLQPHLYKLLTNVELVEQTKYFRHHFIVFMYNFGFIFLKN
jgi:hypothetical protein